MRTWRAPLMSASMSHREAYTERPREDQPIHQCAHFCATRRRACACDAPSSKWREICLPFNINHSARSQPGGPPYDQLSHRSRCTTLASRPYSAFRQEPTPRDCQARRIADPIWGSSPPTAPAEPGNWVADGKTELRDRVVQLGPSRMGITGGS